MDLISPNYLYTNHKLYIDNYYTSLKLTTYLNNYKEECKMCARHDEPEDRYRRKHCSMHVGNLIYI